MPSWSTQLAARGGWRRREVSLEATGEWTSPRSGGRYPAAWRLRVAGLDLKLTPYLADQELPLTTVYWEGAVKIEGSAAGTPIGGNGYVELTGYGERPGQCVCVRSK
jgi:predicted secreted hydrolase